MLNKHSVLIAKILIFISSILLVWSVIIYNSEIESIVNPKNSTNLTDKSDGEEINITTKDNPNGVSQNNTPPTNNLPPTNELPNTDTESNTESTETPTPTPNPLPEQNQNSVPSVTETISQTNNNLRNKIQQDYNISIYYGYETNGYSVGGLQTYIEDNEYKIQEALNNLNYCMSLYPLGFFQEIYNGGIPLTIYLVKNYSTAGVTGATNAFNTRADISIALQYDFIESFNHEVFHYIEKFIRKNGDNFSGWNTLNPIDFSYGNVRNDLSYKATFSPDAPFVNNYAQTSEAEDRASTFEYMMSPTKASCLNTDKIVWRKADYMAQKIDLIFNTVTPNITEYWERFIY